MLVRFTSLPIETDTEVMTNTSELPLIPLRDLPTETYAVILVTWQDPEFRGATMYTLSDGGSWASADGVAFENLDIIDYKLVGYSKAKHDAEVAELIARIRELEAQLG